MHSRMPPVRHAKFYKSYRPTTVYCILASYTAPLRALRTKNLVLKFIKVHSEHQSLVVAL